jgi:hypothetical protein
MERMKFVFERKGKRIVFTGLRAWLLGAPVLLLLSIVGVVIVLLALGAALTLGTVLLIGSPIAVVLCLVIHLLLPSRLDASARHGDRPMAR